MTHTPEEIIDKLGQLSAAEIARLFRDLQVVGRPFAERSCPIANYIAEETGETVWVDYEAWGRDDTDFNYTPPSCKEFAQQFDNGEYPELKS